MTIGMHDQPVLVVAGGPLCGCTTTVGILKDLLDGRLISDAGAHPSMRKLMEPGDRESFWRLLELMLMLSYDQPLILDDPFQVPGDADQLVRLAWSVRRPYVRVAWLDLPVEASFGRARDVSAGVLTKRWDAFRRLIQPQLERLVSANQAIKVPVANLAPAQVAQDVRMALDELSKHPQGPAGG